MMNCFECDRGELTPAIVHLTGERHGESFIVKVHGLRCQECGFQTMDSGQSSEFTKAVSDAYRAAHGLLTGKEIRALRLRLNMTQQQFADYLGTGVASVKRWESGQIQDRAMDQLIRLKADANSARENLRNLQEQNPEPLILFDGDEISLAITMPARYVERPTMTMQSVQFKNDQEEDGADALIAA